MRIHFVYAGDPNNGHIESPYCITTNVFNFLSQKCEVVYHRWDAAYDIDLRDDDILLGHPHYDENTIVQRVFRQGRKCRARCVIHPLHHGRPEDNMPFDFIAREADAIFSIMGPYWYDTLDSSPFAHWKPKITRLDMAACATTWPHHKATFNNPKNRQLVYVGSAMPQKNLGLLVAIKKRLPNVTLRWYGGSGDHPLALLPNVITEGWQQMSQEKVREMCYNGDIFVNTSISDANPTALLEYCLASGLIPICTPQSGYHNDPCFVTIPQDAIIASEIINSWLGQPSDTLIQMSRCNREVLEQVYTWSNFLNRLWCGLERFL